jgi:RHS repeat-associated protein
VRLHEGGSAFAFVKDREISGELTGDTSADGFIETYSYDHLYTAGAYRIVSDQEIRGEGTGTWSNLCQSDPGGPACIGLWTPTIDTFGGHTQTFWNGDLTLVEKTCSARGPGDVGSGGVDPQTAACTAYTYDPDTGLKVSEQRPEQFPSGLTTSFDYSGASFPSDGKWPFPEASFKVFPVTVTNELGHQVHTHTDLGTGATLATYGPNDNEGSYQIVDGFGRALETWISTDVAGPGDPYLWLRTWIFEYQDLASPQQKIERSSRNPNDEAFYTTSYTDTYWAERRTVYDGAGRVIEMIDWRITASVPKTTRRFVYDAAGNLDFATVPDPTTNNDAVRVTYDFSHDSLGRRTCATAPDDTGVATVFGGDTTVVTELVPDGLGGGTCANPESSTMEPHARRTVTVDLFDRVVEVREKVTDTTDAVTTYDYDANSNVARIEREDTGGDIVTAMTHDWVGNRTSIVRDPDGAARTWLYNYDRDGELESQSAPMGAATHYTTYIRDPLGRVDSKMVGTGSLSPTEEDELAVDATEFDYDQGANGIGRLTSVTLPFGSISMVYDAWGNLTDETRTIDLSNALGVTFTDSLTRHADTFTSDGKPMKVVEPSSITTLFGWKYFGWQPFQARAYHQETGFGSSYVTSFTDARNAAGLVKSRVHYLRDDESPWPVFTGRAVYFERDQNGRVFREYSNDPGSSDDYIKQAYTFYGAGEVASLISRVGASGDQRNYTFGYDHQHQLTQADDNKGYSASFTYSPQGRLQTADIDATVGPETLVWPRTVDYAYDSTDPEAVGRLDNASDPGRFADFTHDANGNLTERVLDPDGSPQTFKLTYDAEDRLRVRELPDGKRELYYYHYNARWFAVKKDSVGTVLSARLWFGNAEIQYTCAAGTCSRSKTRTTLRIAGEAVARFDKDVATGVRTERLLHSNRLGHLLGVYSFQDPTGALDYNLDVGYQYGPFGEILEVKEFPGATTSAEDYTERFNGKELDEASGLSYYGYRYYDPLSLTWNRADPLYRFVPDADLFDPRRAGLYHFNLNNPVRNLDPDGRDTTVAGCAIGAAAGPGGCAVGAAIGTGIKVAVGVGVLVSGALAGHAVLENIQAPTLPPIPPSTQTPGEPSADQDEDGNIRPTIAPSPPGPTLAPASIRRFDATVDRLDDASDAARGTQSARGDGPEWRRDSGGPSGCPG